VFILGLRVPETCDRSSRHGDFQAAFRHPFSVSHLDPPTISVEVRFGSLADIWVRIRDVRFTPNSGHAQRRHQCLLGAISGHQDDDRLFTKPS
jgi:hypothetical protein